VICNESLLGCKIIEVAMRLFITVGAGTKKIGIVGIAPQFKFLQNL
jgi:hypothetical protein